MALRVRLGAARIRAPHTDHLGAATAPNIALLGRGGPELMSSENFAPPRSESDSEIVSRALSGRSPVSELRAAWTASANARLEQATTRGLPRSLCALHAVRGCIATSAATHDARALS